ncbi:hypothetical protein ACH50O_08665 [Methylomonas sp. 2BW1-5-20]|uniref:hypothetical protein n=1 Tax=Methylomonas sp. 2BW1-5-20 TaxID=3376686 RepID=UPI00404E6849
MKPILSLKTWLAVCLFAVSGTSFASVWAPSDGNSNFYPDTASSFPFYSSDTFGIFEDNVNLSTDAPVLTFTGAASVTFAAIGANYSVTSGSSTGTLLGSSNFQLAWWSGSSWKFEIESLVHPLGNVLLFANTLNPSKQDIHRLLAVDIVRSHATSDGPSAVPLPASVWMMTSALLGLLYTGRRKTAVSA